MAHITEITIEGLLGRPEAIQIKLKRDVNIFFGENGSGKTTLLKVLDAALSRDDGAMELLPVTKAVVDIYSIDKKKVFKHTWERRDAKPFHELDRQQLEMIEREYAAMADGHFLFRRGRSNSEWKVFPNKRRERAVNRWEHTFLPTTRLYSAGSGPGRPGALRAQLSDTELDQGFSETVNRAWLHFYSKTLSEVRTIQESGLVAVLKHVLDPEQEDGTHTPHDANAVYTRVSNFLARQHHSDRISLGSASTFKRRYDQEPSLRRIVENLDEVERSIERAMIPVNSFLEKITRLFSRGKSLKLSGNELEIILSDGRALPIAHLSSGEKHLIRILLSAMTAGPNTVLIDEPELSMHIDWQRLFVQTILSLNPSCQLILASHSPEIMADMPDSNIFKL